LSFIGNTDLKFQEPGGTDKSPILRLLLALLDPDSELQRVRYIPSQRTRLVLFDDDRSDRDERARFCDWLRDQLTGLGLSGLVLNRYAVALPQGPTDLSALYEQVWKAIPTSGSNSADEVVFHVTSGTPAMQLTLMLASQSLRLDEARLFETSREQGVRELKPPYLLALREKRKRERQTYSMEPLPDKARPGLHKETVIDDDCAQSAYAALFKAASNHKQPKRVLIGGPTGSGKWRACKQFAQWRQCKDPVIWTDPAHCPALPEGTTLLIRWLDVWPESALNQLTLLADERPDLAIAATVRTDRLPPGALAGTTYDGLPGAVRIDLPALGARSDVVALAESLARQLGIVVGKLKERLQHDLFTDVYPRNLHDLKALLATADARTPGGHPERKAYLQARDLRDAQRLLDEAWQVVAGMDFGPRRHRLTSVLDAVRAAVVQRTLAEGRSQDAAGALLGCSQQTVSDVLKTDLDLSLWSSLRASDHAD
jgi:hypothetical protein